MTCAAPSCSAIPLANGTKTGKMEMAALGCLFWMDLTRATVSVTSSLGNSTSTRAVACLPRMQICKFSFLVFTWRRIQLMYLFVEGNESGESLQSAGQGHQKRDQLVFGWVGGRTGPRSLHQGVGWAQNSSSCQVHIALLAFHSLL